MRHWSLVVATLLSGVANAAQAQARPGTADITIAVRTPNAVHVEERYTLGPSPASIELRVLTRPCMVIENLHIERDGIALTGTEARNGPWITWRDTTLPSGDSLRLLVRYNVWLGGSRTIPLAHLTAPLARNDSSTLGAVTVALRFARSAGEIEFPHMTRQAPEEWSGRYVATPSFVKVGGFAFACDRLRAIPDDNGGLVWRYYLLVGIMVAWVPIYLAWARRSMDRERL